MLRLLVLGATGAAFALSSLFVGGATQSFSNKEVFYQSQGRSIQAFLYKPKGTNLPGIIFFHGGSDPTGYMDTDASAPYMENLKNNGYVVLVMNYPGEGKSQGTLKDPIQENQAAIDAVQFMKNMKFVNPKNIGILGTSHGAGVALMTIESVDVKTAVEAYGGVSATEICDYWAQTNQKNVTELDCANLTQSYIDARSPIFNVQKINTPLLIVHGAKDTLIPISQSDSLELSLKANGKTYSYKKYPNSGHGFVFMKTQEGVQADRDVLAWFNQYLKTK